MAAFCFSRGSTRLHRWLLEHPQFGPPIADWNEHRAVSREAKWVAVVFMVLLVGLSWLMGVALWVLGIQVVVLSAVSLFLLTRPSPPRQEL